MTYLPGANLNDLLLRQTAFSVILQGLMDIMIVKELLSPKDVLAIRQFAMDLSQDMLVAADAGTRAAGVRIGEEVEAFLRVIIALPVDLVEDH